MNKLVTWTAVSSFVVFIIIGSIGGCNNGDGNIGDGNIGDGEQIEVRSDVPVDIPGGAANASFREAAIFAWHEFIALNWPALSGVRDTPDNEKLFGDPDHEGPLVWHTFRHKVELYPGSGNPPGFVNDPAQDFGYDSVPPKYVYAEGEIEPCEGQEPVTSPAWINVDEVTQIGSNFMFAGAAPTESLTNSEPQLIRFLAKGNREEYIYVVDPELSLWNHSSSPSDEPYWDMVNNFQAVANGNGSPTVFPGPVIDFPDGTIETKGAFRELTQAEKESGRFYTTTVRYYEESQSVPGTACYREAEWGLAAMHIIHKTPSAPYFIYTTIEQIDNILTQSGLPVEDTSGSLINKPEDVASTTPGLEYRDGILPRLRIRGDRFCENPGQRLFYLEITSGLPRGGAICQNFRDFAIPETVIQVNSDAHEAIRHYNEENGLEDSVWLYYKITNVQWRPFDVREIDEENPESRNNIATFYLSDSVIETDFPLQQFRGRTYFNTLAGAGIQTDIPANFDKFDPRRDTYQNVLVFDGDELTETYNMGGCMGCHAASQSTDFSFILGGGRVQSPEYPQIENAGQTNALPGSNQFNILRQDLDQGR